MENHLHQAKQQVCLLDEALGKGLVPFSLTNCGTLLLPQRYT